MASQPTPEQVIVGYQAAVAQVRARVLSFATTAWRAQGSYRDADVERLIALIVPRVQAGQVQVANLTSAYLASLLSLQTGATVASVPVDRAEVLNGRGVPAEVVYARPATTVYTALSRGASFTDAVAQGLTRLESIAATDLQMAKVRQSRSSMRGRVERYRRVLTGNENCALCALASTQRYWVKDLSPIHPGCDCGVAPLAPGTRPGQVIDRAALDRVHEAVANELGAGYADGRGVDYRKLVTVAEHGEYGPTLTLTAHRFTDAKALDLGIGVPRAS